MNEDIAARILRLPESARAVLATVDGPGWVIYSVESGPFPCATVGGKMLVADGSAWWPANPARAVAAVLGCPLTTAHLRLANLDFALPDDDHAAALSIIEAHVAESAAPRQTVTNLGAVGEVINLQGPVTIDIGPGGVRVRS